MRRSPSESAAPTGEPAADRAELAVALCTVLLGVLIFGGTFLIGLGAGYDRIGPRFFPLVVAAGLVFSGSVLAWSASHPRASARETS